MNYQSAKSSLTGGKAMKLSSWRGYIERVDLALPTAYDPASTLGYTVGTKVSVGAQVYECRTAIPAGSAAGMFDSSKWARIDRDHKLRFHECSDSDGDSNTVYEITETVTSAGITSSDPTPDFVLDGQFFDGFASNDWIVGDAAAFEAARSGTSRW